MASICLYFQVHQPNRLIPYDFFQIGDHAFYEDDKLNGEVLSKVSDRCYLPANHMFQKLIEKHGDQFKLSLSLSGVFLEQCEHHRPDVIYSFQQLVKTGRVEILAETYYHSLACLLSPEEFEAQVKKHAEKVEQLFGVKPKVFRNTELIYNNALAATLEKMGYDGVIAEGIPAVLGERSPNRLHRAPNVDKIVTLLRNRQLSDDVAFRRTDQGWKEYPLAPQTYAEWLSEEKGSSRNLFMDYETIGEHQDTSTGVFDFWNGFVDAAVGLGLKFSTPSEVIAENEVAGVYDCHEWTSWADHECDLSAWRGNVIQGEAMAKINELEADVAQRKDDDLTHVWRKLQTSDHYYYMSTKTGTDGDVHQHFSPYPGPYDAYIYFMNAVSDLQLRVKRTPIGKTAQKS